MTHGFLQPHGSPLTQTIAMARAEAEKVAVFGPPPFNIDRVTAGYVDILWRVTSVAGFTSDTTLEEMESLDAAASDAYFARINELRLMTWGRGTA